MIELHILGPLPVPEWYPNYLDRKQNDTHWAGVLRLQPNEECPAPDDHILAKIETNGESTWGAMLASLSPDRLAALRAVHPEQMEVQDLDGKMVMMATSPIVTFAYQE